MTASQLAFQIFGFALAIFAVVCAVRVTRRENADPRLPLARSLFTPRALVVPLGGVALLAPMLWAVFTLGMIPRGSPPAFVAFLCWMGVTFIAGLLAVVSLQARKNAAGFLTLVDAATLKIEVDGATDTLTLAPGGARLVFCEGPTEGAWAQFELTDGEQRIFVYAMLRLGDIKLVTEGPPVAPRGLILTGSSRRLVEWCKPHLG